MDLEYISIDKRMAARGNLNLKQEPFFGLAANLFVTQIGDGRETGCYRTDNFCQPFKYAGSFIDKNVKYFAFQVPENMLPENSKNHFLLYESTGSEILSRKEDYVRFYSPEFKERI